MPPHYTKHTSTRHTAVLQIHTTPATSTPTPTPRTLHPTHYTSASIRLCLARLIRHSLAHRHGGEALDDRVRERLQAHENQEVHHVDQEDGRRLDGAIRHEA